jgi:hypothetical protein
LVSEGEVQSGSSMSIRPSPSLSIPSEHCVAFAGTTGIGGVVEGVVVVVVVVDGVVVVVVEPVEPDSDGAVLVPCETVRPGRSVSVTVVSGEAAVALPTAARPRKTASARVSRSLLFMRLI